MLSFHQRSIQSSSSGLASTHYYSCTCVDPLSLVFFAREKCMRLEMFEDMMKWHILLSTRISAVHRCGC
jgi:hypothetical protein